MYGGEGLSRRVHSPWDHLPSEIYLLIFNYLPDTSLAACMFVSQEWRNNAEYIIQVKKKWDSIFYKADFKRKCDIPMDARQMYRNYILWHSVSAATLVMYNNIEKLGFDSINVYRDHLNVVSDSCIEYYDSKTSQLDVDKQKGSNPQDDRK